MSYFADTELVLAVTQYSVVAIQCQRIVMETKKSSKYVHAAFCVKFRLLLKIILFVLQHKCWIALRQ